MAETKIFGITINTDSFKSIPESYKVIAGGVLSLLILLGGGYYLLYPIYTEYQTLLEENETLSSANKTLETKLGYSDVTKRYRKIDETEKAIEDLNKEIDKLQERIPKKENLPSLIYDMENLVEINNKSDLFDLVPGSVQRVNLPPNLASGVPADLNLSQTPLNLTLESSYPNMISLFKDFEKYQRAINPASVSLSPISDSDYKFSALKVSLNLRAYLLPEGGN